jgi:hypothetical protein
MKTRIILFIFLSALVLGLSACGGARKREARARERERRHQESKDQLDRDKKNFGKTFDNEVKED